VQTPLMMAWAMLLLPSRRWHQQRKPAASERRPLEGPPTPHLVSHFFDDDQNLPNHRHAVKDYFPMSELLCLMESRALLPVAEQRRFARG
jgi:hypothetical protein